MLLKSVIKDSLEIDEETNQLLKAKAEATEYLYNLLAKEGISA